MKKNPSEVNVKYLKQFPEFFAFYTHRDKEGKSDENNHVTQEIIEQASQTPQEILETSYQSLRQTLAKAFRRLLRDLKAEAMTG